MTDLLKELSTEQNKLVADVLGEGTFDPENNPMDASVLYETTGFCTTLRNEAFWHEFFFDYGEIDATEKQQRTLSVESDRHSMQRNDDGK